ncbi:MAG: hypothetical protein SNJ74_10645 [Fimbriimonadaceae bacterium]
MKHVVGIEEPHRLHARFQLGQAQIAGRPGAGIGLAKERKPRIAFRPMSDPVDRVVGAAVVDDDAPPSVEILLEDARQRVVDERPRVVRGDNHGHLGHLHF